MHARVKCEGKVLSLFTIHDEGDGPVHLEPQIQGFVALDWG